MTNMLNKIFTGQILSGVFQFDDTIHTSEIHDISETAHFSVYEFDGAAFNDKSGFIQHFGEVMQPPLNFIDWDFFERHLETTEWMEKDKGKVIIYKSIEHFYQANRQDFDILIDIFESVTKFRNKRTNNITPILFFVENITGDS